MPNITETPSFDDLLLKLQEERDAARALPSDATVFDYLDAYNRGKTLRLLEQTHPRYSPARFRVFPFFYEEEDAQIDRSNDSPYLLVLEDVLYRWKLVTEATTFSAFAAAVPVLEETIVELLKWHYAFDPASWTIRTR